MEHIRCDTCGQGFLPKRNTAKRYCSAECYYNRKGGRITEARSCEVCGAQFWPDDSAHAGDYRQRACGRACSDVLRRRGHLRSCAWCQQEFYVVRNQDKRRICCSRKCSALFRERQHREKWVSGVRGRYIGANGYVVLQLPPAERAKHSARDDRGRIMEHRYVMEKHLGRPLKRHETIHHKNGDRADNRLENLEFRVGSHGVGATKAHCSTCTCFIE